MIKWVLNINLGKRKVIWSLKSTGTTDENYKNLLSSARDIQKILLSGLMSSVYIKRSRLYVNCKKNLLIKD